MIKRIETFWKIVGVYLTLAGLVTFSLFILEEAFQTTMFGSWPAKDAKEWRLVKRSADTMEFINNRMKTVNRWFGWIQPLAWVAYDSYGVAADEYVENLRSLVFAHCPECMDGTEVRFTMQAREMDESMNGYHVWKAGKVRVLTRETWEGGEDYQVTGTAKYWEGKVWVYDR